MPLLSAVFRESPGRRGFSDDRQHCVLAALSAELPVRGLLSALQRPPVQQGGLRSCHGLLGARAGAADLPDYDRRAGRARDRSRPEGFMMSFDEADDVLMPQEN